MANRPVVGRREVERIARLAHVSLDDEERKTLASELGAIVAWVRKLEELDVTDVEPTSHPIDIPTRLRDDTVGESLPAERGLGGAPQRLGDGFGVPRVIG